MEHDARSVRQSHGVKCTGGTTQQKKLGDPSWLSKKSKAYRDAHLESRRKDARVQHHKRKARAKIDPELAARIKEAAAACWRKCDPVSKRLWTLKERAAKKNVPFDLDKEYLSSIIPETCPVLGEPIHFNSTRASRWSVSVDRIVPELGYVRGNIMVMSKLANCMKQDATPEELVKFAQWVLSTYAH